jgi:hypothetical protein
LLQSLGETNETIQRVNVESSNRSIPLARGTPWTLGGGGTLGTEPTEPATGAWGNPWNLGRTLGSEPTEPATGSWGTLETLGGTLVGPEPREPATGSWGTLEILEGTLETLEGTLGPTEPSTRAWGTPWTLAIEGALGPDLTEPAPGAWGTLRTLVGTLGPVNTVQRSMQHFQKQNTEYEKELYTVIKIKSTS